MLTQGWLLVLAIAGITALNPAPYDSSGESLRSALNAINRKQRSLDSDPQDYFNDLRSFKYHGGDVDRKFDRERPSERIIDEEDEEIEFLPEDNGQLETVGNNFQNVNNKLLEKTMIDYLENAQEPERVPSIFRERERSSSRKRSNIDRRELAKLFLEELQDGSAYVGADAKGENYLESPQIIYDRYRRGRGNKLYENEGPMSWGEVFSKGDLSLEDGRNVDETETPDKDPEQSVLYFLPAERRNVNGRYPLGRDFESYRNLAKRYPVAKRSPKPLQAKRQITDPKVAQDLGALFGTQPTENRNNYTRTRDHDHGHDHGHDHDHAHDHGYDHEHEHDHDHDHDHDYSSRTSTSEAPKVSSSPKGQKENITEGTKVKGKTIDVKKKSIDWSQYFGIDRRKKKATFMARQDSQNQDDEWMLQRYYENMAENLKPLERESERDNDERKDKLEQMDARLKTIKDQIIEETLRNADSEDSVDMQKVKDRIMARMAAAYSLEKMRKALNELRNNLAIHKEIQRSSYSPNNLTQNYRDSESNQRNEDKRMSNSINNEGGDENKNCQELDAIERRCRTADNLAGDGTQMLYLPCVILQICKACAPEEIDDECLANYAVEAGKICDAQDEREGPKGRERCASTALILSQLQPPISASVQCRVNGESCLRRFHYRYRHRYLRNPYGSH